MREKLVKEAKVCEVELRQSYKRLSKKSLIMQGRYRHARQGKRVNKQVRKLYSLHAPEVECIAKGKAHKKYEFGCKVSVATTSKDNFVVGSQALHGNPYDGHTLNGAVEQAERLGDFEA
jgi:transposase, IS5 family